MHLIQELTKYNETYDLHLDYIPASHIGFVLIAWKLIIQLESNWFPDPNYYRGIPYGLPAMAKDPTLPHSPLLPHKQMQRRLRGLSIAKNSCWWRAVNCH